MKQDPAKNLTILIVEDNPGDIRLIKEAMKTSSLDSTMYVAHDGVEAIHFLETRKRDSIPQLIVLDLNLPKKSGVEVLQFVKRDEMLKEIPVVVLTSSQNPQDINKAYDLHANCYLTKPANFDAFADVVKALEFFGTKTANPPSTQAT